MLIKLVQFSVSTYFPPLVRILRSHTAKILLAVFIWTGIGIYLIHPVQAKTSSHSFTRWLETVVKKDTAGDIEQQIFRLKQSGGSLAALIEEASEMVSRNNDDFNLPIGGEGSSTHEVYNLLLVEWNSYQTGNGMGKACSPEAVKSNLIPTVDKFSNPSGIKVDRKVVANRSFFGGTSVISNSAATYTIEPLSGGIAIGAP